MASIVNLYVLLSTFVLVQSNNLTTYTNILVINQFPINSHSEACYSVVQNLLKDGHSVSYITPTPIRSKNKNLTQLIYKVDDPIVKTGRIKIVNWNQESLLSLSEYIHQSVQVTEKVLKSSAVQNILTKNDTHYDAVVAVWDYNELVAGVAAILKSPMVWVTLQEPSRMSLDLVQHSDDTQILSDVVHKETLTDNFKILLNNFKVHVLISESKAKEAKLFKEVFESAAEKLGAKLPDYQQITNNASMLLFATHPAVGRNHAMPPNAKYFGGSHVDNDDLVLKKDLKSILEKSKNGVILCNLGRDIDSHTLPLETITGILKVFGKLKQTVIWKFDRVPNSVPANVHVRKSFPHADVLEHANTLLYINNAEIASLNEAVFFGKPVIVIPLYLDHFYNANVAVDKSIGRKVTWGSNVGPQLQKALTDVLHNPSYGVKAQKLSDIYHDRYLNPGEEVSEWISLVARTRGAPHLRSSGAMMPWYDNLYFDNLIFILLLSLVTLLCVYKLCQKFCCGKRKKNSKIYLD